MRKILLFILFFSYSYLQAQNKSNVAFFISDGFPTTDAQVIDKSVLDDVANQFKADIFRGIESFNKKLNSNDYKLLVLPYGSAFPIDAWLPILNFLNHGGSLVYLGGSPFNQPVIWKDSSWILGMPQQTFARQLLIGPSEKIVVNSDSFYEINKIEQLNQFEIDKTNIPVPEKVYEIVLRFTNKKDFKDEDGSSGPRDAVVRPLIHLINNLKLPFATPVIEIDRLQGVNAGARWIFAPCDAKFTKDFIVKVIQRALEGAVEISAVPVLAAVKKNESPQIRINLFRPNNVINSETNCTVNLKNESGKNIFSIKSELTGIENYKTLLAALPKTKIKKEGFYSVDIEFNNADFKPNKITTGFWVKEDIQKIKSPNIAVTKDWIRKDGKVFPIIGTSYMASDVHRKFLIEPNPNVWKKDFELMKSMGINFVRTGLWNSWDRIMLDRGAIDESFLSALDAFVLTAAQNNIVVCFTFFAFTPPLNNGTNPYLDPRALDWQKTFITLIASRYKNNNWIHFDLINEPSYSPPNDIWKNIPIGDYYEKESWTKWIHKKYGDDLSTLNDKWRDSSSDIFSLPNESELSYRIYKEDRRPRKALDFNLFTQDVVTNWADTLNNVIKKTSGALVTLGQDEGGTSNRPSQQFHFNAVDYTSMHTWWYNDDLLWDGLMTKVPEKPNLISETGLMRLETIDGELWRSPIEAENLLDRKFALAFAAQSAGVVQWAWNINPYMPIDNEAVIGFFRPDGTAKQEIRILKKFSDFYSSSKNLLEDYSDNGVYVVIPHSKIFSGRKNGELSTKRVVRALADHFGIIPTLLSEYKLSSKRLEEAKLIIVPTPEFLNDNAIEQLFLASRNGIIVLFTGAVEGNSYGEISESLKKLKLEFSSAPISLFEYSEWTKSLINFDNQQSEFIKKSRAEKFYSSGNIFHEPLPIELAREREPLNNMLKHIMDISGVEYQYSIEPLTTSILYTKDFIQIICVNESSKELERRLNFDNNIVKLKIKSGRSKLALVDRKNGNIIVETE